MKIDPVSNSPAFIWRLRYLEWLFILVHLMLAITAGSDISFNLLVYGIFIIFSLALPRDRSLRYRQGYILLAMASIISANFLDVSLDLLIYLYIAKSFFLIGGKRTVWVTIATGIGWVASEYYSEIQEIKQLNAVRFQPPFGAGDYSPQSILIFASGLYIAVSIFVIFLGSIVVAEHKSRKRAEALGEQVEILAKNLERTRIARDIHDSLGHTLTDLDIQLKVAQKLRDRNPEQAFEAIDTAATLSAQCIEDVSHAVQTMRRSDFNLDRALNNLLEQARNNSFKKVRWELDLPQLSLSTSHQIYCMVKEGLINIQKHANASMVGFWGYSTAEQVILKLEDNGIGFNLQQVNSGFGLQGMMERVQIVGGKLKIDSAPGKGTQILITIPR